MERQSLAALTRGIHHAASSTHAMLAQQYMHMMMQFFDEKDGKLMAKMTYVQVDDKHWVPVPLISLVSPRGLALDKMKVLLSVKIEESAIKQATIDHDGSYTDRVSLKVTMAPRSKGERRSSDVTDIEMEFTAGDPPEAVMRIIDSFTNLIDPKNFDTISPPVDRWPPTPIRHTGTKLDSSKDKSDKDSG